MIILAQTTDSLQVVLAASATTQAQCFVSYRNTTSSAITPLRNVTATNNTTAVTLVPSPSASNQRVVDYISIYNANSSNITPTIRFNDNGTTYELFSATIAPGEKIEYQEGTGFLILNTSGGIKTASEYGIYNTTVPWTTVVLSTDVTNSNAVASTMEDVTGLSFSATTGTYWYRIEAFGATNGAGRAGAIAINGPAFSNAALIGYAFSTAAAINGGNAYASSQYNATANTTAGPTWATISGYQTTNYVVEGFVALTANGTIQVRHSCSNAGGSFTTKAGSAIHYYKVL